jgi:hypothetical protein
MCLTGKSRASLMFITELTQNTNDSMLQANILNACIRDSWLSMLMKALFIRPIIGQEVGKWEVSITKLLNQYD